jgi:hypothetical protein
LSQSCGGIEKNTSDPVRDGELIVQYTDVRLPSAGIPFEFVRTYRSRVNRLGVLGYGWDHNFNRRLLAGNACGDMDLTTGDGGRVRFTQTDVGSYYVNYAAPDGVPMRLTKHVDVFEPDKSVWQLKDGSGRSYFFDAKGFLSSIEDSAGNALRVTWDQYADTTTINRTVPFGSELEWRVSSVQDTASGRTVYFVSASWEDIRDPSGKIIGEQGLLPFLSCLSLVKDSCERSLMRYQVDDRLTLDARFAPSFPDTFRELISVVDAEGTGQTFAYYHNPETSTYLPDELADQYCASACGAAADCHNSALCDRPQSACLQYLSTLVKQEPLTDVKRVCVDSLLEEQDCARQSKNFPYPAVINAFCPAPWYKGDYGCNANCIANIAGA